MCWNDTVKVPVGNFGRVALHASAEQTKTPDQLPTVSLRISRIKVNSLLVLDNSLDHHVVNARSRSHRSKRGQRPKRRLALGRLAILLVAGQVEQQIRLDECTCRLVQKCNLLVVMRRAVEQFDLILESVRLVFTAGAQHTLEADVGFLGIDPLGTNAHGLRITLVESRNVQRVHVVGYQQPLDGTHRVDR